MTPEQLLRASTLLLSHRTLLEVRAGAVRDKDDSLALLETAAECKTLAQAALAAANAQRNSDGAAL